MRERGVREREREKGFYNKKEDDEKMTRKKKTNLTDLPDKHD